MDVFFLSHECDLLSSTRQLLSRMRVLQYLAHDLVSRTCEILIQAHFDVIKLCSRLNAGLLS